MILGATHVACLLALAQPPVQPAQGSPAPTALEAGLACARAGDVEGAQRLWLGGLDAAVEDTDRATLLEQLVRLGRLHPPTRAALVARRDALVEAIRKTPAAIDPIVRLVAFNSALGEGARTADLYEDLLRTRPDADLATLAWCARPDLWRARRYAALRTTCADPQAKVAAATAAYADVRRRLVGRGLFPARTGAIRVRREALMDYEAMLALRERDSALRLGEALLAFEPTLGTRARLIVHAERAGASFAARALREPALPPGDDAAASRLQHALEAARREVRAQGATDVDLPESKAVGEHGRGG